MIDPFPDHASNGHVPGPAAIRCARLEDHRALRVRVASVTAIGHISSGRDGSSANGSRLGGRAWEGAVWGIDARWPLWRPLRDRCCARVGGRAEVLPPPGGRRNFLGSALYRDPTIGELWRVDQWVRSRMLGKDHD